MADNDRIAYAGNDISAGQQAPSQAQRTEFYPGKATSRPGDMNFEIDFRVPQGTPAFDREAAGPVEMERRRIIKLHRGSVSDQTIGAPVVTGSKTTVIDDDGMWGTGPDPQHTVTETETQDVARVVERISGEDHIVGP